MKRLLITALGALCIYSPAIGCYVSPREYLAAQYCMFRLLGNNMNPDVEYSPDERKKRHENCILWRRLSAPEIALNDIYAVVYKWSEADLKRLYRAIKQNSEYKSHSKFALWIRNSQRRDICQFLLLAKHSEELRKQWQDPWYYPVKGDSLSCALDALVNKACNSHAPKLEDRYLLQALRILSYSGEYSQCYSLWESKKERFKKNVIGRMAMCYAAGALFRLGEKQKASEMFFEAGELEQGFLSSGKPQEQFPWWVYRSDPEHRTLSYWLQKRIHALEAEERPGDESTSRHSRYLSLLSFTSKVIQEGKVPDMAPWYYTAAFLSDKCGDGTQARKYAARAMQLCSGTELRNSVRVLNIYLRVKNSPAYDITLERYLLGELKWLDSMIIARFDNETKKRIADLGYLDQECGLSQYYWLDMMRKIVISELAPLCMRSSYTTRALQYLNMADNRIHDLLWDSLKLNSKRANPLILGSYNLDYGNSLFINLDSLEIPAVQRLAHRIEHPRDEVDRFLGSRGCHDPEYFYSIIGTKQLARMQYSEAARSLSRVSGAYTQEEPSHWYMKFDPFTARPLEQTDSLFKLHFARKMARLEKRAQQAKDVNDRAEAMSEMAYAITMTLSEKCWPLVSYYRGAFDEYPFYSSYVKKSTEMALGRARYLREKAFASFTDPERAAKACLKWNLFRTAATKYRQTEAGKYVRGHCDELKDYKLRATPPTRLENDPHWQRLYRL